MSRHHHTLLAAAIIGVLAGGCGAPAPEQPASTPVSQPWAWELPQCVGYQPAEYQAPAQRQSAELRAEQGFTTHVEQYRPGWGARAVAEIQSVVRECARYEYGERADESFLEQNRVVETGFAGDESLLVETVHLSPPTTQTWYAAVVRCGDEVVTVRSSSYGATEVRRLVEAEHATCA